MRINKEKPKNPKSEITGPMLLAQKILAPEPQLQHPGTVKFWESPGSESIPSSITFLYLLFYPGK